MRIITCVSPRPIDDGELQISNEYLLPEGILSPERECRLLMAGWDIRHDTI